MDPKEIIFSPEAEKAIKKLSKQDQKTVWGAIKKLRAGDGNLQVEKIKANPVFYRARVSNFRVIYYPLSQGRVVLLLIGDRKAIYRKIASLDQKLGTALKKLRVAD
ncbi:type II toxin-antitoxin system RelE family toxin [Primorskyibacter sp. S187A]|uniref:type II toxin-antitoxin system RelE family toxin n=1 Tax=Primorskyibacter sp. S187A TaxID=3415130 RepID=UPI003C7BB560